MAPAPPAPPDATLGASPPPSMTGPGVQAFEESSVAMDPSMPPPGDVDAPESTAEGPSAQAPAAGDPPAQVGRLRSVEGQVSVASEATNGQPEPALVNRPVTANDALRTSADGFAECSVPAGYLWMAPNSRVHVVRVDASGTVIRLHQGSLAIHAQGDGPAMEIEVPGDVVVRARTGQLRVDVSDTGGNTIETAAKTRVVVQRQGVDHPMGANMRWSLQGEQRPHAVRQARIDPFAAWVAAKEAARAPRIAANKQGETLRHVSAAMPGYEDLADNGRWRSTPEYGAIWQPSEVASDWAPYRFGRWTFLLPWGWTWVDDASWGFAPFHYGRWIYWQNAWAWAPGPFWSRPVYAPHLVAWGGGQAGYVSWYPLGFGASWWPAYPCSYGYAQQLNRPYAHVGGAPYARGVGGPHGLPRPSPLAITQVAGAAFTAGAPTSGQLRPFGPGAAATRWGFHPPAAPPAAAHAWQAQQQGWRAPQVTGPAGASLQQDARGRPVPSGGPYGRAGGFSPGYRSPYTHPAYQHEPIYSGGPGPARPLGGNWIHLHNGGVVRPGAGYPGSVGGGWGRGGSLPAPHMGIGPGGHGGRR